jgi:hypothetical protein
MTEARTKELTEWPEVVEAEERLCTRA